MEGGLTLCGLCMWLPPLKLVRPMASGLLCLANRCFCLTANALRPMARSWLPAADGLDGACHQQRRWADEWHFRPHRPWGSWAS